MTKLNAEQSKHMKDRADMGRQWIDCIHDKCPEVKFLSHYALLGQYDFMDIYEAPDEETAAKVSMISMQNGAYKSESHIAIPYNQFVKLAEDL
jgi:uncharacterized protein with GYD domain